MSVTPFTPAFSCKLALASLHRSVAASASACGWSPLAAVEKASPLHGRGTG